MSTDKRRFARTLALIPIAIGLISTFFFYLQGGFGAGHGRFDLIVGLNVFPLIFFYENLPLPQFIEDHDILLIIWFPALLNAVWFFLVGLCIDHFRKR